MADLDSVDRRLIALLRGHARMPVVELARRLGVSRATVQNRMQRLEREGVIRGYTVELKAEAEEHPIRALAMIAVEGKKGAQVCRALRGYPDIVAIHNTNGRWDLVVEIRTETLESFNRLLGELRLIDGVVTSETSLLLDTLNLGER
ncbi:Lrp/AsnC family transcriptional regulator [Thiolapillus sp.]